MRQGAMRANHSIGDCHEGEVLHLRSDLDGPDYELIAGYYVLREVMSFSERGGISYAAVSQAGEDADGTLIADGKTHLLPRHALGHFVGIGLRAQERFSVIPDLE